MQTCDDDRKIPNPPTRPLSGVWRRIAHAVYFLRFVQLRVRCRGGLRAVSTPITAGGIRVLPSTKITLGRNVALGRNMYVETNMTVGDDVLFSGSVAVVGDVHPLDGPGTVFGSVRNEDQSVVLEGDNLVGYGVIIIGPCRFKRGAVAGAGAVVTGVLEADTIYVGVPGRALRIRRRTCTPDN